VSRAIDVVGFLALVAALAYALSRPAPLFRFHRAVDPAAMVCADVPVSGRWQWRCVSVGRIRQLAVDEGSEDANGE
jgi:hypothetical protein